VCFCGNYGLVDFIVLMMWTIFIYLVDVDITVVMCAIGF